MKRIVHVLVLALLVAACARKPADDRPPIAVRAEIVDVHAPSGTMRYSGTVAARTQVDLAFRAGGYVDAIATTAALAPHDDPSPVAEGSHPKPRAKRTTRALQAGDRVAAGAVLASLRLADFKQRVSELGGMRAETAATYRKAKVDLDRAKQLLADGAISKAEYDAAKARHDAMAASTGVAAARVGQAGLALSDAELKSPFDGIVLERKVELGALVSPGVPAFVVADTSVVKVTFGVPDTVEARLSLGQDVEVTTDAHRDRSFPGVITKIGAQADARTRVFDVEATFDNADGLLKVGMVTSVQVGRPIGAGVPASAISLPLSAVVRPPPNESGYRAYVVVDERGGPVARARSVDLGPLVGSRVSVARGLAAGDRVVVQGATLVRDGQRVVVVTARAAP